MEDLSGQRVLVISDTHINHRNIVKYCGRPTHADGMIIRNFQNAGQTDVIIHVGDFGFFKRRDEAVRAYDNMIKKPGHPDPILVRGNHDKKYVLKLPWERIVQVADQPFVFSYNGLIVAVQHRTFHDPLLRTTPGRWLRQRIADLFVSKKEKENRQHFFLSEQDPPADADIAIHGHIHELGHRFDWIGNTLVVNACVEHWDYQPFTMDLIVKEHRARKAYVSGRRRYRRK